MEQNKGLVLYNTFLKGYLDRDDCFSKNLALARIFSDESQCSSQIARMERIYKEVPSYDGKNIEIKHVSVQII